MGGGLVSEPSISAVVLLDSDGERIAARYYTPQYATLASQQAFEKALLGKALKSQGSDEADIVIFDGLITVFRGGRDCFLFVTGDQDENEIILVEVLNTMYQALSTMMPVDRRSMMDKLDMVLLALDELVDGGVILEIEPSAIVNRVGMRGADADQMPMGGVGPNLQAQTPQQALQSMKDTLGTMARAFKAAGAGN
uniref:Coatomer subunit zeta n=1 Tax=Hemiselmis andersenii TaxID=464988 RepID=A0A6U4IHM6_HEMAN|mmetsp:Transcript_5458/g.12594  ORF Transcript_5458/g.12594 Transcript_5458/m.12594 type:complete len:196 (+) Transcript_5458:293-880(+)|eukprot:CAMPEP_0114126408 /NCGR_PEP_ID=MMETSP0043_2-20121206/9816_1 /TAXON_ID=464988 /ORGANISM="Hemiselmis andersenii, Strain CCMP644" /LENGTH=195 /DNA_ID=CAMNT_0001219395 /DNA_START=286 /DNA_END=873 /DNA_ORIENTATION=+